MEEKNKLDLVMSFLDENKTYEDLLSVCIGKAYSNQIELQSFLGDYKKWGVSVPEGKLSIDDKEFNVDFIGTTSSTDRMWFNADLEEMIPQSFLATLSSAYTNIQKYGLEELLPKRIKLDSVYTDHSIAIIYTMLSGKNTCFFKGSGDVSVFVFFNEIPEEVIKPIDASKFLNRTMRIIQNFDVKHKLMVKSFAINNGNEFEEKDDSVIVKFGDGTDLTFKFDSRDRIANASGAM